MFAFVLLLFVHVIISNAQNVEEVEVIIMGAGMTGIMAGHVLSQVGNMNDFVIIEAQDYIGGRTKTIRFGTEQYGLSGGASWISGACIDTPPPAFSCRYDGCNPNGVNPMLTYANQLGMSYARTDIHEWDHPPYPPYIHGPHRADIYGDLLIGAEYQLWWSAQSCIDVLYDNIWSGWEDDVSYSDALAGCGWNPNNLNNISRSIQWTEYDLEFASPITQYSVAMSYGGTYCQWGNQDLFITDDRGYQGITLSLASDYLDIDNIDDDPKIQLNSPIELIEYDANGVTVHIKDSNTAYHAKYGLVTFSVGVLQGKYEDVVSFSPSLPSWKLDAIHGTNFADYIAVYIEWPYNFWELDHPQISENEIIVLVDETYGYFPWFLNIDYLRPGSLIWRFDTVEWLAIKLQNQDISQTVSELREKFSKYFTVQIPEFNIFVGNWSTNPYTQGAYAAYPVGYDWYGTVSDMQWPVEQVLYFGGEATDLDESGYVHTAYYSGKANGERILNCLGIHNGGGAQCQGPHSIANNTLSNNKKSKRNLRKHGMNGFFNPTKKNLNKKKSTKIFKN